MYRLKRHGVIIVTLFSVLLYMCIVQISLHILFYSQLSFNVHNLNLEYHSVRVSCFCFFFFLFFSNVYSVFLSTHLKYKDVGTIDRQFYCNEWLQIMSRRCTCVLGTQPHLDSSALRLRMYCNAI